MTLPVLTLQALADSLELTESLSGKLLVPGGSNRETGSIGFHYVLMVLLESFHPPLISQTHP